MFEIELVICIKMDLALNNLQRLICHKTQTTKAPTCLPINLFIYQFGLRINMLACSFYFVFSNNFISFLIAIIYFLCLRNYSLKQIYIFLNSLNIYTSDVNYICYHALFTLFIDSTLNRNAHADPMFWVYTFIDIQYYSLIQRAPFYWGLIPCLIKA